MKFVASVFLVLISLSSLAANEVNISPGLTLKGYGLAVHGYDAVAFFTEGRAIKGSAAHVVVHEKAVYRFTSAENKKAFKANPSKYAPQFGGYCAFGVSVGAKFDGDPEYWNIEDGKLYLVLNRDIQKNWLKDLDGNITKARKSWGKIAKVAPSELK